MFAYVMSLDSSAILSQKSYYLWYKGMYMKYMKSINRYTGMPDFQHTDSFFALSSSGEQNIWIKMAEFARAWAYANDLNIRLDPGMIISTSSFKQIESINYECCKLRTLARSQGFVDGAEFIKVTKIDTTEQADLLKLYTTADASPDLYQKILFFWHTIVYPHSNDFNGAKYINEHISRIDMISSYIPILYDGTFGNIENNDIGSYIQKHIRNAIAHIRRNNGTSLIIDDISQAKPLDAVAKVLKAIAKYKLDNDFCLKYNLLYKDFHMFNPKTEF